jgi:hypothetical protein
MVAMPTHRAIEPLQDLCREVRPTESCPSKASGLLTVTGGGVLLFVFFLFSDSPLVAGIGIRVIPLFLIFAFYRLLFRTARFGNASLSMRCGIALFMITCLISATVNQVFEPILFGLLATTYLVVACTFNRSEVVRIVELLSSILLATAALGLLALILSTAGFPRLFTIRSLDFVPFSLLYGDMSFKRVAGFMHEPGQLSFYICACVVYRELLGLNRMRSVVILALGLLTQSLAHIVFTAFFVVYLMFGVFGRAHAKKGGSFLVVITALVIVMSTGLLNWAVDRAATFISSPEEWGRFVSFNYSLLRLDSWSSVVFGPSPSLAARQLEPGEMFSNEFEGVSIYGENPLSPLIFGGLLGSWPYYLFIIAAVFSFYRLKGKGLLLLSFSLLTLQRPYTLEFPYALWIGLMVCITLNIVTVEDPIKRRSRKIRIPRRSSGGVDPKTDSEGLISPTTLRNEQ